MVANWIKVKGVVPLGRGHKCLLAWRSGEVTSGWYIADGHFQHADGEMDYHKEDRVTHWAEMPEHPLARAAAGSDDAPPQQWADEPRALVDWEE